MMAFSHDRCLVLHDPALAEQPDQVEIVHRGPGIAPDRGALEARIRPIGVAREGDVPVVIGEEELLAVLARGSPALSIGVEF